MPCVTVLTYLSLPSFPYLLSSVSPLFCQMLYYTKEKKNRSNPPVVANCSSLVNVHHKEKHKSSIPSLCAY